MKETDLSYIAADLRPLAVPIESLHEDPANARTGHAVERIAASFRQYGQRKPLVVNRSQGNKVEAGNGGLQAARSLGWSHVAVVFVEDDPATAAGYGIADNRVGELSEWDLDALEELRPVTGDVFTGFEPAEWDDLLGQDESAPGAGIGMRFLNTLCQFHVDGLGRYGSRVKTVYFHTSHPGLCEALRRDRRWRQVSAVLYGGNKRRSIASIHRTSSDPDVGKGAGYGGHFRAVQGFKYLGEKA